MTSDAHDRALAEHGNRWLGPLCGTWPDITSADWEAELVEASTRLTATLDQPDASRYQAVAEELTAAATGAGRLPAADPAAVHRIKAGILTRLARAEELAGELRREAIATADPLSVVTTRLETELAPLKAAQ